jgi:outer membrane protein assembly factor BamB
VVTDGERIYAHFGSRGLYAFDWQGHLEWQKDLGDMETRLGFGEGSSPALWGDTLVINWDHEGESFLVALDKRTGNELWRRSRDEVTSWATPIVVDQGGRPQVIVNATRRVRSYDLQSGESLWEVGGMTVNTIPSPVHGRGMVYATSGFRGNALLAIRLADARGDLTGTDSVAWSYDRDTPYVPSPLLYENSLYMLKHNSGVLTQLDARTGEVRFGPLRLPGIEGVFASPVAAAGRVYIAGRNGTTLVIRHGPELEVLAENQLDEAFNASPAMVGDEIFLRGRRHLYCIGEGP